MRALLDVNVLIALFDASHVFNDRAHLWLEKNANLGVATCPLSENGLVRILSNPRYSKTHQLSPSEIIFRLASFCQNQDHSFWPDSLSLCDPEIFLSNRLIGHRQLTGHYLLALAVRENGRLVTFDKGIAISPIIGARAEHLMVI